MGTTVVTDALGEETSRQSAIAGAGTLARTVTDRDAARRETGVTVGAIGFTRTLRDTDGKLSSIRAGADTISFGYDDSGRKGSESGELGFAGDIDATYTYTETGRLLTDTATGALVTYGFDAAGNIATEMVGAQTRLYSYDAGNRLASTSDGANTTLFGWDTAHGWRTSQGLASNPTERAYGYTGTGRLASLDTNSGLHAAYEYDAAGQRTRSTVISGAVTTDTSFVYEGLSLLSLSTTETAGVSETTASVTYLYDGTGAAYAGVYRSAQATPVVFTLVSNDRGDVLELRDEAGVPFAAYSYDAWGVVLSTTTRATGQIDAATAEVIAHLQPLRYAGYVYDEVEGLYYLSARTYDPATRQFLTKDPAKADGEESAYQYCGGNPVGKVDPSGLTVKWLIPGPQWVHASGGFVSATAWTRWEWNADTGRLMVDAVVKYHLEKQRDAADFYYWAYGYRRIIGGRWQQWDPKPSVSSTNGYWKYKGWRVVHTGGWTYMVRVKVGIQRKGDDLSGLGMGGAKNFDFQNPFGSRRPAPKHRVLVVRKNIIR